MVVSSQCDPPTVGRPSTPAQGVLLDVQGTVLDPSGDPYPGAREAVLQLKEHGIPLGFASNVTSVSKDVLLAQLQGLGFPLTAGEVVTTSQLTADYLRAHHPDARVMVFAEGTPFGPLDELKLVEDDPDVLVLGGVGDWLCRESLDAIFRHARRGVPLIAMHRNVSWQSKTGLSLDLGGVLPGIEAAGGVRATVIGKPSPTFFALALDAGGMKAAGSLMVGDDVNSDVRAAQALGLTGVLVKTGKCVDGSWQQDGGSAPDFVIDSIADLPAIALGGAF